MTTDTLAIDFGTSNSAAAILEHGHPRRVPIEAGGDTLPTAVFLPAGRGRMRIGAAAIRSLTDGDEGRFMRAMKSVLGTDLMGESRLISGRRLTLAEIVTEFLVAVKARAEAVTGYRFAHVLSGRPVHFATSDPERDAAAEADLAACYREAGFRSVRFRTEPEAAALATGVLGREGETGLVVDIGGGTSDFALYRLERGGVRVLAAHGLRLGGTDYDRAVSLAHVMPLLGHGGEIRREFGPGRLPMPPGLFLDLARWETIAFLYTPEIRREARQLAALAVEPEKLSRLETVLRDELGHDLAFAAERGKIEANAAPGDHRIALDLVEPGLSASITAASLAECLAQFGGRLAEAAAATLDLAGLAPSQVDRAILVGGSSLMQVVGAEIAAMLPGARIDRSEAFTAVVDGLALATDASNAG